MKSVLLATFILLVVAVSVQSTINPLKNFLTNYGNDIGALPNYGGVTGLPTTGLPAFTGLINSFRRRCPICDSSVYSYCSDKLFHDSCCCHNPNNPYDRVPLQCQFADCSFLHANSCQEHKLITACCCVSQYYKK
ncbi:hypothetical protein NQ318_008368 [Aromia moschata]|uniref:Uncharacterized protein n=1 Tax=Aromia moschata TaxID=1265417 RepID=A0AAV8YHS2_9CUCU|nr:hypothetical protein NQ318_008368 [Aromia moschata]